jgi:thiol-disulfide isomerase/thioredoxin
VPPDEPQPETAGVAAPKPGWTGRVLLAVIAVVLGVNLFIVMRAPHPPPADASQAAGAVAPVFSGGLLAGGSGALSDYQGKVVLLDFWATWCQPCMMQMPILESLQRKYAREGRPFTVVGVNADGDTPRERILAFARRHPFAYPVFFDEDGTIAERYGVQTIPHLVLIDRKGRLQKVWSGISGQGELENLIEPLLK